LAVGQTVRPVVLGRDDFAVRSATLLVDGKPVDSARTAPYVFRWTPEAVSAGKTVTLSAVVTDSSGQTTTSGEVALKVSTQPAPPVPGTPPVAPTLKVDKVLKKPAKGRSTVYATVNTAGRLSIGGSKVATSAVRARRASTIKITLKPTKAQRKILKKKGALTVTFVLRFTADTGGTKTIKRTVVITQR
jgi:hypothetical protein